MLAAAGGSAAEIDAGGCAAGGCAAGTNVTCSGCAAGGCAAGIDAGGCAANAKREREKLNATTHTPLGGLQNATGLPRSSTVNLQSR